MFIFITISRNNSLVTLLAMWLCAFRCLQSEVCCYFFAQVRYCNLSVSCSFLSQYLEIIIQEPFQLCVFRCLQREVCCQFPLRLRYCNLKNNQNGGSGFYGIQRDPGIPVSSVHCRWRHRSYHAPRPALYSTSVVVSCGGKIR